MFADHALEEIERWRQRSTSPSPRLDWRWIERYRGLDAYDAFWWWAQAGPSNEEKQRQWDQLCRPPVDEATKERLGGLLAQARQRELHLSYPALDIQEIQSRIAQMQQLGREIDQ